MKTFLGWVIEFGMFLLWACALLSGIGVLWLAVLRAHAFIHGGR